MGISIPQCMLLMIFTHTSLHEAIPIGRVELELEMSRRPLSCQVAHEVIPDAPLHIGTRHQNGVPLVWHDQQIKVLVGAYQRIDHTECLAARDVLIPVPADEEELP